MKQLINCIAIIVILASCGYDQVDNFKTKIVVTSIQRADNACLYYGKGSGYGVMSMTETDFRFIDTCGKFQIGDTLNIIKNK